MILKLFILIISVMLTRPAVAQDQRLPERLEGMERRLQLLETEKRQLHDSLQLMATENSKLRETVSLQAAAHRAEFSNLEKRVARALFEKRALKHAAFILQQKLVRLEQSSLESPHQIFIKTENLHKGEYRESEITPVHGVSARSDDAGPLEPVVTQLAQRVTEVSAEVQALKAANTQQDAAIQHAGSSVYVRWGNAGCPSSTELVYTGVIGGSYESQPGAASNYLCLSMAPVFSDHPVTSAVAYLYGGEYETQDSHQNKDPVCSVCRSQHATTIMVPGTNVCLPGWSTEYIGFLMAGYYNHPAATEFICVDSALDNRISSDTNHDGKLLYYTVTQCGSLPCTPYVDSKIVTCAVCSK